MTDETLLPSESTPVTPEATPESAPADAKETTELFEIPQAVAEQDRSAEIAANTEPELATSRAPVFDDCATHL